MKLGTECGLQVGYGTAQIAVFQPCRQRYVTLQVFSPLFYFAWDDTYVAEKAERTGATVGQEDGLLFQPFGGVVFEIRKAEQDAAHLFAVLHRAYLQSACHGGLGRVRFYHVGRLAKGNPTRMGRKLFLKVGRGDAELRKPVLPRTEEQ